MPSDTERQILFDLPEGLPEDIEFLRAQGHEVLVCHGPPAKTLCPILSGQGCDLVAGAHGIVFELDLNRPQHRTILRRYKEAAPEDCPIWVVASPEDASRYLGDLMGVKVLSHRPVAGDLDALSAEIDAADFS